MAFESYGNVAATVFIMFFIILLGVIVLGVLAIGGYFLWRLMRYKIKVVIHEKVGDVSTWYDDFAREVVRTEEGGKIKSYLHLLRGFKGKKRLALPDSITYSPMGMRKFLQLRYRDGVFLELKVNDADLTYEPAAVLKVLQTYSMLTDRNIDLHKPKQGWLDKYGMMLAVFFPMMMHFVLIIVIIAMLKSGGGGGGMPQLIK